MMRPISFKKATKAQREEFMAAVTAEAMKHVDALAEKKAKEKLADYVGQNLTLKSIQLVYGKSCTWRGVPVTPDQFQALEEAHGLPRRWSA